EHVQCRRGDEVGGREIDCDAVPGSARGVERVGDLRLRREIMLADQLDDGHAGRRSLEPHLGLDPLPFTGHEPNDLSVAERGGGLAACSSQVARRAYQRAPVAPERRAAAPSRGTDSRWWRSIVYSRRPWVLQGRKED